MSNRLTRILSALVLTVTLALAGVPLASAAGASVPNRSHDGGSGASNSVNLACTPTFLAQTSVDTYATTTAPRGITTAMLLVEQDSGDVYLMAGQRVTHDAIPGVQVASSGCLAPV